MCYCRLLLAVAHLFGARRARARNAKRHKLDSRAMPAADEAPEMAGADRTTVIDGNKLNNRFISVVCAGAIWRGRSARFVSFAGTCDLIANDSRDSCCMPDKNLESLWWRQ